MPSGHPITDSSAAPQIRPWHGPMPARVYSLAWRGVQRGFSRAAARPRSGTRPYRASPARCTSARKRERPLKPSRSLPQARGVRRRAAVDRRSGRRTTGNLTFDDREIDAADPRRLAGAVRRRHRRRLTHIDFDVPRRASNSPPGAPARYSARVRTRRKEDRTQSSRADVPSVTRHRLARCESPRAATTHVPIEYGVRTKAARYRAACASKVGVRHNPAANRATRPGGACSATSARLAPARASDGADRQHQRPCSGHDHAAAAHRHARPLSSACAAADAEDVRQRPARERQEAFARPRRENDRMRRDFESRRRSPQRARASPLDGPAPQVDDRR